MTKPTLGVVVPSFNSAKLLPAHLDSMRPWLDLADEIVVVDSHSTDGTQEIFERELLPAYPRTRLLQHPRGLYQSWNFGIRNIRSDYLYVSTVGDPIERWGIEHLLEVAGHFASDAVVSKPRFIDESGTPMGDIPWPVDDVIATLGLREPRCLEGVSLCIFVLANRIGTLFGSSASNLYRTACFQAWPFSVDYGASGDCAWLNEHALDARVAVTPRKFSAFRDHPKSYSKKDYEVNDLPSRQLAALKTVIQATSEREGALKQDLLKVDISGMLRLVDAWMESQGALERERAWVWPWSLNPRAWLARWRRNRNFKLTQAHKLESLRRLGVLSGGLNPCPTPSRCVRK